MKIRKMTSNDIDQILSIGAHEPHFKTSDNSPGFWTKKQLEKSVVSQNDVLLVAEDETNIIGFNITFVHAPSGKATMENLWISESCRGKGVGKQLVQESIVQLKEKGCSYLCNFIHDNNEASIGLFENLGFDKGHKFYWMSQNL